MFHLSRPLSALTTLACAAALLSACGEPIDMSELEDAPAEVPPPAVVEDEGPIVAAASPLEICLRAAGDDEAAVEPCYADEVQARDQELERYLVAVRDVLRQREAELAAFEESHTAWAAYRTQYCDTAVAGVSAEGGETQARILGCRAHTAADRTHQVWSDFLVGAGDDGGNVLPEPLR